MRGVPSPLNRPAVLAVVVVRGMREEVDVVDVHSDL